MQLPAAAGAGTCAIIAFLTAFDRQLAYTDRWEQVALFMIAAAIFSVAVAITEKK